MNGVHSATRREFVVTAAAAGVAAAFGVTRVFAQRGPRATRNWAWMRGDVPPLDEWRRQLSAMKSAGIDAILITGSPDFYQRIIPPAKAEGIEVHAWFPTMMRGENAQAHPEWYVVSRDGASAAIEPPYVPYYKFLCPSRDDVRQYLAGLVRELGAIDDLASVHLDYIRYPDVILPIALWPKYNIIQDREYPPYDFCYCDVCRARFRKIAGSDPMQLAQPWANREWLQYRHDTITEVVGVLAAEAHAAKKQLTAAVFPTPSIARALVRQDWTKWKVDAVLPMIYNGFYKEEIAWVERATREGVQALGGRIPLYSGLYVPDLSPADLAEAVRRAFAGGAAGISLFQGNTLKPEHWEALAAVLRVRR